MRNLIVLILIFFTLLSCKTPQSFEYRDVRNIKIDSLGFNTSTIHFSLVYFNPNNYGVDLRHVDCEVYINRNYLGKYVLDTLMHIAKKSEFEVPSTMQVDMKNIFKNTFAAILLNDVLIQVKGTTRIGKGGIFINIPFTYEAREKIDLF